MDEIEEENINVEENIQSLKESLESCKNERKSLITKLSEVVKERDEAFLKHKSSEKILYCLSFLNIIVAISFAVLFSMRQAKSQEDLIKNEQLIKDVQSNNEKCMAELAGCHKILFQIEGELSKSKTATEHIKSDLLKCESSVEDMNQDLNIHQNELHQCNNTLASTQEILGECISKPCIKEDEHSKSNNELEKSMTDLNECNSRITKLKNINKKHGKNDRKLKKCQSCMHDLDEVNKKGVHVLKNRVLQIIRVERPWRTARKDCQERGGDLFVPRNTDKLADFLLEKEPGEKTEVTNYWVGISDLESAGEFRGVNGGRVVGGWAPQNEVYRRQNPGEISPGAECVLLTFTDTFSKGLAAIDCDAAMHYICDMDIDTKHDIFN